MASPVFGNLSNAWTGARFAAQLPLYLRRPWTPEAARAELEARLRSRDSRFLEAARRLIFCHPGSPYLKLLRRAGCEYGDLAGLVRRDGIEGALDALFREGVYLTVEEFKGRRPVVRGGTTLSVTPESLRNPRSPVHLVLKSGGSRSRGSSVFFDLGFIRRCAADTGLALHLRGGDAWDKATWEVPGGGALFSLFEFSQFGARPVRWFSQLDPRESSLPSRYRWSNTAFGWGARLAGVAMPRPRYAPLESPAPIVDWMAKTLKGGRTPYLLTYPSSALRVVRAAGEAGVDLRGSQWTIAGEPCTETRMSAVRRAGGAVLPKYGIMETGPVGYGCSAPAASDDIHLMSDLHAVIQPGTCGPAAGLEPNAVLFTSLMVDAPVVLLNASMGDQAVLKRRACGCPMEALGWTDHLREIRSGEKLTCGGMNFLDADVVRVLEDVLPARFGGGPSDYQLLEEEDGGGAPGLKLLVHPRLGAMDERLVRDEFLAGISRGGGAQAVMGLAWNRGGVFRVERCEPLPTRSGKILHLHVSRGRPGADRACEGEGRSP
jgi:hypothetical protein